MLRQSHRDHDDEVLVDDGHPTRCVVPPRSLVPTFVERGGRVLKSRLDPVYALCAYRLEEVLLTIPCCALVEHMAELARREIHTDAVEGQDVAAAVDPLVVRAVFGDRGVVHERR